MKKNQKALLECENPAYDLLGKPLRHKKLFIEYIHSGEDMVFEGQARVHGKLVPLALSVHIQGFWYGTYNDCLIGLGNKHWSAYKKANLLHDSSWVGWGPFPLKILHLY
jgi:hypothetical protein